MVTSEEFGILKAAVTRLEAIVGLPFMDAPVTPDMLVPANELSNGRYPQPLSDFQLHTAIADIYEKIDALVVSPLPAPVVIPPAPVVVLPPVPAPSDGGDVAAQLAAYDIHLAPGKLAIGMEPDLESQACFQIGGRVAAEIQGRSNTGKTDSQNPEEVHESTLVIVDNDGGARLRQYQTWWKGMKRNTTNRKASTFALFDSMGDTCVSHVEVGAASDGGQSWYIRTSGKVVEFATYKVGGAIRILKSVSGYGSTDQQQL